MTLLDAQQIKCGQNCVLGNNILTLIAVQMIQTFIQLLPYIIAAAYLQITRGYFVILQISEFQQTLKTLWICFKYTNISI